MICNNNFPTLLHSGFDHFVKTARTTAECVWLAEEIAPDLWSDCRFVEAWFKAGLPFTGHHPVKNDREIFLLIATHGQRDLCQASFQVGSHGASWQQGFYAASCRTRWNTFWVCFSRAPAWFWSGYCCIFELAHIYSSPHKPSPWTLWAYLQALTGEAGLALCVCEDISLWCFFRFWLWFPSTAIEPRCWDCYQCFGTYCWISKCPKGQGIASNAVGFSESIQCAGHPILLLSLERPQLVELDKWTIRFYCIHSPNERPRVLGRGLLGFVVYSKV